MTLRVGSVLNARNMASSDIIVFPDPVGAPMREFISV